jgi:hypothetical protein
VSEPTTLTRSDIHRLFDLLNAELALEEVEGEIYLVGGAVMCLVFNARPATRDVDAYFLPAPLIRQAAARVAASTGVPVDWLNDAVKGFMCPPGEIEPINEQKHLRLIVPRPQYLVSI